MSLARRTFASLANPAYRYFFAGNVLSLLGFWMRLMLQGWLVYELTGSREALGVVTALGLLPMGVLSLAGGVLGDRLDRRRILLTLPLVSVASNVILGTLVVTGQVTVGWIVVLAVLIGCARAIEIPVRNAFVRDVVGMADLRNAIALNAAGFNVARVVGPAVGAGLLAVLDMGYCFYVAAAFNASMVLALMRVRVPRRAAPSVRRGVWSEILEGLRYVRGHRRTRMIMLLFAITLLCTWSYQTLLPAFAKDRLGMGESGYGLVVAVIGLGAFGGALWVAARASTGARPVRRNVVFGLVAAGGVCVALLGLSQTVPRAVPLLLLAGFCQVGFMATANGMVQESVPDELRARVMGLWTFLFGIGYPIGALLMGGVAQAYGIRAAWTGGALVMIGAAFLLYLRTQTRSAAEIERAARRASRTTEEGPAVTDPAG